MRTTFQVCCFSGRNIFAEDVNLSKFIHPHNWRTSNFQLLEIVIAGKQVQIGIHVVHDDVLADVEVEEVDVREMREINDKWQLLK